MADTDTTKPDKTIPVTYTGTDPWTAPNGRLLQFDDPVDLPEPVADRLIAKGWAVKTPAAPAAPRTTTKPKDA